MLTVRHHPNLLNTQDRFKWQNSTFALFCSPGLGVFIDWQLWKHQHTDTVCKCWAALLSLLLHNLKYYHLFVLVIRSRFRTSGPWSCTPGWKVLTPITNVDWGGKVTLLAADELPNLSYLSLKIQSWLKPSSLLAKRAKTRDSWGALSTRATLLTAQTQDKIPI